ncbi:MAG TPA: magnesium transporter CorA family protein, partial [Verrucomicrobiae bacterium]|nr:magnesium transporter CorA family protein [Verrucomicrobiae bacterium]
MIRSFIFNAQGQLAGKPADASQIAAVLADPARFIWIDLEKPPEKDARALLEGVFHFHPISVEDCIMVSPSPKVDDYTPGPDDKFAPYIFMVMHAVDYNRRDGKFATSELNFFLGKNYLVTYHDVPLRTIATLEARVEKEAGRLAHGPDRLAHLLLDTLVENYKPALDELSQEISELEQSALHAPPRNMLDQLLGLKKEVRNLCRVIGPQSDVLARLATGEFKLIRPKLLPYFRNVRDDLTHIGQTAQGYVESLTGILQ